MDSLSERCKEHAAYLLAMDQSTHSEIVLQVIGALNEAADRIAELEAVKDAAIALCADMLKRAEGNRWQNDTGPVKFEAGAGVWFRITDALAKLGGSNEG